MLAYPAGLFVCLKSVGEINVCPTKGRANTRLCHKSVVCCLSVTISRFKELRLSKVSSKVSNASRV